MCGNKQQEDKRRRVASKEVNGDTKQNLRVNIGLWNLVFNVYRGFADFVDRFISNKIKRDTKKNWMTKSCGAGSASTIVETKEC